MIILLLILFLGTCQDFRSFKISNRLIVAGYLVGLAYQLLSSPLKAVMYDAVSMVLIWMLMIPLFSCKVIGGGDCKLFTICGLFTGFTRTISIIIYAFLLAGIVCIFLLAYRWYISKKSKQNMKKQKLHFSIYILLGVIVFEWIGGVI